MRVLCNGVYFLVFVKMNLNCICGSVFAFVVLVASAYFDDSVSNIYALVRLSRFCQNILQMHWALNLACL